MAKGYVLYNKAAGDGKSGEMAPVLGIVMNAELVPVDIRSVTDYPAFLKTLAEDDFLVIAGGDGTLNRFANDTDGLKIPNEIYYFPCGTGNDFAQDVGKTKEDDPFPVKRYLQGLPTVEVRGTRYKFLNGVGYGIDGYCCEIGDQLRKIPGKKVDYTAIAIRGLLTDYAPTDAVVTVDGVRHEYKKVWIAPTMKGRFYGGGMMPAPDQDRLDPEGKLSVMVFHGSGRLRTLMIFPSIFRGRHIRHRKQVEVLTGHDITVEFSSPRSLQIDGETILNVRSYTAKSRKSE